MIRVVRLRWLACEIFEERIKKDLEYVGGDFEQVCLEYKKLIRILPILLVAITIVSFLTVRLVVFSEIGVFLVVYFYPLLYSWSKKEEYKKEVNQEAPLISIIAYVNSLIDKNVLQTIEELLNVRGLKVPSVEYQMIKKSKEVLNESSYKAVERRAILHKDDLLGKIYSKFLIAADLGISIKDRMRESMREILQSYREEYKNYVERSAELSEMIFAVYLLLPIVLVGFQFTFKVNILQLLFPLIFTPAFIFLTSAIQPVGDYQIKASYKYILPLPALILITLTPLNLIIKFVAIIAILSIPLLYIYRQILIANYLLSQLPDILNQVSDYMKIGYSVVTSLTKVRAKKGLGYKILEDIIRKVSIDNEIPEVNTSSKLFNNVMNTLKILSKSGLTSVGLEELSDLVNDIIIMRNSMLRQLRLFDVMLFLTPIMLWLTFSMLGNVFSNSKNVELQDLVIFFYSLANGLIFSKISRFVTFYLPAVITPLVIATILSAFPHGI